MSDLPTAGPWGEVLADLGNAGPDEPCPCGCPWDMHIGEVGCPCALPDEPPCVTSPGSSAS